MPDARKAEKAALLKSSKKASSCRAHGALPGPALWTPIPSQLLIYGSVYLFAGHRADGFEMRQGPDLLHAADPETRQ